MTYAEVTYPLDFNDVAEEALFGPETEKSLFKSEQDDFSDEGRRGFSDLPLVKLCAVGLASLAATYGIGNVMQGQASEPTPDAASLPLAPLGEASIQPQPFESSTVSPQAVAPSPERTHTLEFSSNSEAVQQQAEEILAEYRAILSATAETVPQRQHVVQTRQALSIESYEETIALGVSSATAVAYSSPVAAESIPTAALPRDRMPVVESVRPNLEQKPKFDKY